MPKSAYIHIPFCLSKCKYCSFVSFDKCELIPEYIEALLKEIKQKYQGEILNTLYFGGGTPSLLSVEQLKQVLELFNYSENGEITIEVNPDSVDADYLKGLKRIGFNRISIGSQTFDDKILKLIGRRHDSEQIICAVEASKRAGFENISLDLIYGLPTQSLEGLKKDLEKFTALDIQHISTYGLKIEENSYFGSHKPSDLPDEDTQADMYLMINNILENAGFKRYEVSNFTKVGYESKHNLNYWNNDEYYGFGLSAHGYIEGIRYSNACNLNDYIENPFTHENEAVLSDKEKLEEEIFLGFRKREGVNIERIKERFNVNFEHKYKNILDKYSDYFEKTARGYCLNTKGTLLSNIILAEFLED